MTKATLLLTVLFFASSLSGIVQIKDHDHGLELTTFYGTMIIDDPVIIELIRHPSFERLKHLYQYGVMRHARTEPKFTRYQHSLGVFFLTKKFGAPLSEQISALLHDVSHTVFSHVGDKFFRSMHHAGKDSYQDEIHEWYLEKTGITSILHKYNYDTICSAKEKKRQPCLEQKLPDLCTDRIEYNLSGAFIDDLITPAEIVELLDTIEFKDRTWFFNDVKAAKTFGLLSLYLCENRWGSAWGTFVDHNAAEALRRAVECNLLTHNDIHFSTDDVVWKKLCTADDPIIAEHIRCIQQCESCFRIADQEEMHLHLRGRFTGTDPLVMQQGELHRLTEIDSAYAEEFHRVKNLIAQGWKIQPICSLSASL
jgi:hypothetical protein